MKNLAAQHNPVACRAYLHTGLPNCFLIPRGMQLRDIVCRLHERDGTRHCLVAAPNTSMYTPTCSKPAAPHGVHLRMPSSKPSLARYGCLSPDIGLSPNMPNIRRRRQMAFYQPEAALPCGRIRSPVSRFSAARRELHGFRRARSCVLALCGALPVRDASGLLARGAR